MANCVIYAWISVILHSSHDIDNSAICFFFIKIPTKKLKAPDLTTPLANFFFSLEKKGSLSHTLIESIYLIISLLYYCSSERASHNHSLNLCTTFGCFITIFFHYFKTEASPSQLTLWVVYLATSFPCFHSDLWLVIFVCENYG